MLPSGSPVLLTDTVGFINKLPTSLIAAFRATLEEISESSLILHVVDVTHRNAPEQVTVVESILDDMGPARRSDGHGSEQVRPLAAGVAR